MLGDIRYVFRTFRNLAEGLEIFRSSSKRVSRIFKSLKGFVRGLLVKGEFVSDK